MNFFDTSVLVASVVAHHIHHPQSLARITKLRREGGSCAAHTLAETFNTLTRASGYGLAPLLVYSVLQKVQQEFTLIPLTPNENLQAIGRAAHGNVLGPRIFDCLLIACARKVHATAIYTNNTKDFRQVAPDLASIIHEP